jgi:hypothetical protein
MNDARTKSSAGTYDKRKPSHDLRNETRRSVDHVIKRETCRDMAETTLSFVICNHHVTIVVCTLTNSQHSS